MQNAMQKMPEDMEREILSYLLPDLTRAQFHLNIKGQSSAYARRYEALFINGDTVNNNRGEYLSRIYKKNGKHRYYITRELIDCIEVEYFDRPSKMYHYDYMSKYVGNNLENALLILLHGSGGAW
jgi:hypothetical protein